ncbi:MAG: GerMN domain-containing protein [Pyrinomonadaceae bacterium]
MRSLLLCIIATVSLSPLGLLTRAQTTNDLRSKYGPPSEVFQINPGLSLTAKYTDEGLTCEVDIVQRDVVFGSTLVSNNLPDPKTLRHDLGSGVKRIIAELMPEDNKRGRTISTGKGQIGNCYGSSTDDYDLVKVSRSWEDCGARSYSARIVWKTRRCKGTPVPVVSRDIELWVYFTNPKLPEWAKTCGAGDFVQRKVAPTKKLADAALKLLFTGPNVSEQAKGMEGLGPLGNYYRGVSIKDGVAVVNFRHGAEKYLHVSGPACGQEQVLTPIVKTLKRLSTITSVDFAINGKIIEEWDASMKRDRTFPTGGFTVKAQSSAKFAKN